MSTHLGYAQIVRHSLNTEDVVVQITNRKGCQRFADVTVVDENTVMVVVDEYYNDGPLKVCISRADYTSEISF